jgi:gamma-glutamylaminecyclotransferase
LQFFCNFFSPPRPHFYIWARVLFYFWARIPNFLYPETHFFISATGFYFISDTGFYFISDVGFVNYDMENNYLFVYGTLKRGFNNHSLINHCEFIGSFISEDKFDVSGFGFPCAYPNEKGKLLKGEIYKISDRDFISVDALESNGSLYQRELRKFKKNNKVIEAWIYIIIEPFGSNYKCDSNVINWDYSYNSDSIYY